MMTMQYTLINWRLQLDAINCRFLLKQFDSFGSSECTTLAPTASSYSRGRHLTDDKPNQAIARL